MEKGFMLDGKREEGTRVTLNLSVYVSVVNEFFVRAFLSDKASLVTRLFTHVVYTRRLRTFSQ